MIMDAQIQIYPWLKEVLEYALLINKDDFNYTFHVIFVLFRSIQFVADLN